MILTTLRFTFFALALSNLMASVAASPLVLESDPHRNELGFFDIHLCNWPDRAPFLKVLFATNEFDRIGRMEIIDANGVPFAELDKKKYLSIKRKGKPERRVFLLDIEVSDGQSSGWYSIRVTDKKGNQHTAQDLVPLTQIKRAKGIYPADNSVEVPYPVKLAWEPVPGAGFYQVYVRDAWTNERVFESKLDESTEVEIPTGTLDAGGTYYWVIHSRDINEHILLGDFHNGSMSSKMFFTLAE